MGDTKPISCSVSVTGVIVKFGKLFRRKNTIYNKTPSLLSLPLLGPEINPTSENVSFDVRIMRL